jgi:hypothetical protein
MNFFQFPPKFPRVLSGDIFRVQLVSEEGSRGPFVLDGKFAISVGEGHIRFKPENDE